MMPALTDQEIAVTDRMQTLQDDLAYVRDLVGAYEGAGARRGGFIMAAGGVIFAACSLFNFGLAQGALPLSPSLFAWSWVAAMAVFLGVLWVRLSGDRPSEGVRSRTAGALWSAVGWTIGVAVLCCVATGYATRSGVVWAMLPSMVFALYGAGWSVTATLTGARWCALVAAGAYAAAVAIGFLSASAWVFAAYAAGLLLLATAPGLYMMRRAGRA